VTCVMLILTMSSVAAVCAAAGKALRVILIARLVRDLAIRGEDGLTQDQRSEICVRLAAGLIFVEEGSTITDSEKEMSSRRLPQSSVRPRGKRGSRRRPGS
jgi:hypothetical protein